MTTPTDPWARLRAATPARIALGGAAALPTDRELAFRLDHARARDAVHAPLDTARLARALAPDLPLAVASAAPDRATYLRRPDLGRIPAAGALDALPSGSCDIAFVLADGLSARAVQAHAAPVLAATRTRLAGLAIGPVVIATQARVAIGDAIGARLGARLAIVLIGERPGLTVADSLGAYLTFRPRPGTRDSARNCVSNIHGKGGLSHDLAAQKIAWLAREALRLGLTGTGLKENAGALEDPRTGRIGGD